MKVKFFLYRSYQYKLLQEELNKLGEQGYMTKNFGMVSFFTKTPQPVHYIVDLYKPQGKNKYKRNIDISNYMSHYLDYDYKYKGKLHFMHVFSGYGNPPKYDPETTASTIKYYAIKYMLYFIVCLLGLTLLFIGSLNLNYISDITTNGGILIHYFPFAFFIFFGFYFLQSYINYQRFYKKILSLKKESSKKIEKVIYRIENLFIVLLLVVGCFGFIEDGINRKNIESESLDIYTLKDFGDNDGKVTCTSAHSILIPHSYKYYEEYGENEDYTSLSVNIYKTDKSDMLIEMLERKPEQVVSTSIEKYDENTYIGKYYDDTNIYTVIYKYDGGLVTVVTTFNLEDHIDDLYNYYNVYFK